MAAGIDDISIYIPRLYLDAGDFAKARGLDPEKLERGLGIGQMAIVDTNQDPACLAANACLKVMQKNKLTPDKIGRLYVATESSFDESKAMNSYVIGMLEQVYGKDTFGHCGGIECKFACVSGSYALYDNTNWIRAGEAEDKYALVVVSDIAKKVLAADKSVERTNIYEIMTKPAVTVHQNMDIRYCARLFEQLGLSRAPVVEHGKIIGIISHTDMVLKGLSGRNS